MKKYLIIAGCLLLNSCMFGTSKPSDFYSLQAETAITSLSKAKYSIGVNEVGVFGNLSNPQIILKEKDSTQQSISETNRWAESLDTMIQYTLVNNLMGYLPNAYIKPRTYSSETFKYSISLDVNQMTGVLGEQAVLAVWWKINNAGGETMTQKYSHFSAPVENTYDSYVRTQSELLNKLAKEIATFIAKL